MKFIYTKRFWPLFVTQFFGAFNDNFLKNAMLILVAYQMGKPIDEIGMISNIAAALFIAPYCLFSAIAGQLADKYDRAPYCRIVKIVEIVLMLAAGIGFWFHEVNFLLVILFFMGAQSTFFSPAKYSLLPTHLKKEELLAGNAWIEGGTYLAILTGLTGGGLVISRQNGNLWCGAILILFAVVGYWSSRHIPSAPPDDAKLRIDWNIFRQSYYILKKDIWRQLTVRRCVFAVSAFWLAGSVYATQMPLFTKIFLGGNEKISTFFFVLFSVGIGVGAALSNLIFRGQIRGSWWVISAAVTMGLFTFDLAYIGFCSPKLEMLRPSAEVLKDFTFYRVAADFFLVAICGGLWSVPLQSLMQLSSEKKVLARVIAGNNIVNAFYMAGGGAVCAILMGKFKLDVSWILFGVGCFNILAAAYMLRLLPHNKK